MDRSELEANKFYWAKSLARDELEIVYVSTIFGTDKEFWTVATIGSEEHAMPEEFVFLCEVFSPEVEARATR
ncbi:hypothetical protein HGP14_23695 [Rhizobium sp. P32RR-XVIII]|nr:hypothetical protein [Rhizobium sp. P32RR-XVIII]